ncbi:CLUMA_CG008871, isoform A [Clunio marinus]|uniref:CLUMA_CG008871, isoform A n=1 Tax=Clunio marinus TaxID=568069 RepID=A0A1J1I4S7_9DIPT|nr:CLUMA_CG008871, isoform A [Clunio marinus]
MWHFFKTERKKRLHNAERASERGQPLSLQATILIIFNGDFFSFECLKGFQEKPKQLYSCFCTIASSYAIAMTRRLCFCCLPVVAM